ncbi:MAG: hypothetical protein J5527_01115 [Treponema sp.]|nr:hypothetical protein [Treponema sp.]
MLLSGCENFLNGAETKSQLDQLIKEANAPTVEIYMAAEKDAGNLSPNGIVTCKLEKPFTVFFDPSEGYEFIRWEAVDRITGQLLTDVVSFDNPKSPETKATITKEINNIQIKPVYIEYPRVVSYTPEYSDYGSYANSVVLINFNVPMVYRNVENIFNYDNISILNNGNDISEYFSFPVLSEDKKTLVIKPYLKGLAAYMTRNNTETLEITVSLDRTKIKVTVMEKDYYLRETENNRFIYKIRNQVENKKPFKVEGSEVVVSKEPFTLKTMSSVSQKYSAGLISTDKDVITKEQVLERRIGDSVYIYGKYKDEDSGVQGLVVQEKLTNKQNGTPAYGAWTAGTISDIQTVRAQDGSVEFCLKYTFVSTEGALSLRVAPIDYCDNVGDEDLYTFIKPGKMDPAKIIVYNLYIVNSSTGNTGGVNLNGDGATIPRNSFETQLRTIKINDETNTSNSGYGKLKWNIYGDYNYSADDLSIFYDFDNQGYIQIPHDSSKKLWEKDIGTNNISGKSLNIKVTDDLGNAVIKKTSFPDEPTIIYFKKNSMCRDYKITMMERNNSTGAAIVYYYEPEEDGEEYDYTCKTTNVPLTDVFSPSAILNISDRTSYRCMFIMQNGSLSGLPTDVYAIIGSDNLINIHSIAVSADFAPNETLPSEYPVTPYISRQIDSSNNGKTNVTVSINSSALDYYESFYIKIGDSGKTVVFPEGQNTCSFTVDTYALWRNNITINLYCFYHSGNTRIVYGPVQAQIPSYSQDMQYDNTKPSVYSIDSDPDVDWQIISYDYLADITFSDSMSGIKEIKWSIGGSDVSYSSLYDYYIYNDSYLPVFDMDENAVTINVEVTDKQNLTSSLNYAKTFYEAPALLPQKVSETEYYVTYNLQAVSDTMWYKWKYDVAVLYSDSDWTGWNDGHKKQNWVKMNGYNELNGSQLDPNYVPPTVTEQNGKKIFTYKNITLEKDKYYKIVTFADMQYKTIQEAFGKEPCYYGFSNPYYFYTGEPSSGDLYDSIIPSSSIPSVYFITSDRPVFVNTVITKRPVSECKTWSYERWNCRHQTVGEAYLSFSPYNKKAQSYTIDTSAIPYGYSYVVVAHFADGSVRMSDVRQMK